MRKLYTKTLAYGKCLFQLGPSKFFGKFIDNGVEYDIFKKIIKITQNSVQVNDSKGNDISENFKKDIEIWNKRPNDLNLYYLLDSVKKYRE